MSQTQSRVAGSWETGGEMTESVGAALRRARRQAGRTLKDLAGEVGVSAATLSRAETGRGPATADLLVRCSEALGLVIPLRGADDLGAVSPTARVAARGLFAPDGPGAWRRYDLLELEPCLRAAVECFVDLGYHGTTVRDLARIAGLSLPALYHRYPSKQDLLVATMVMLMEDFRARCEAARDEGRDEEERFVLLVECFALFHTYRRELAFIGASEMRSLEPVHRRRVAAIRNDCQRLVDHEVGALAERGRVTLDHPEDAARAAVTMLVGIAGWYQTAGSLTPEDIAQRYVAHARALIGLR